MRIVLSIVLGATLILAPTAPTAAQEECMVNVAPDRDRGILGDLKFYNFDPMLEVQVDTPSQPSGITFVVALDGVETPDIVAYAGLDDMLLSLAPPDGDIAIDQAFVARMLAGEELAVFGLRDSAIVTFASYDLTELAAALAECGLA